MSTDVDGALIDVLTELRKYKIRFDDEGRAEFVRIFNGNLGLYLRVAGTKNKDRDLWGDTETQRLKNFILHQVMVPVAKHLRTKWGANPNKPTREFGKAEIFDAVKTIATEGTMKARCEAMLEELEKDISASSLVSPICTEFSTHGPKPE